MGEDFDIMIPDKESSVEFHKFENRNSFLLDISDEKAECTRNEAGELQCKNREGEDILDRI